MSPTYFFKDVTLLITHYNRSGSLERLLKTCRDLGYTFEDIVISDDGSKAEHLDQLIGLQEIYNYRLITTPKNRGLGHSINKGQYSVKTPYTLYIQEDFVPNSSFAEHFLDGFQLLKQRDDLDIVRFYSYLLYPHLSSYKCGFSEMVYKPWSLHYKKIYYYSDHPHLRRSTFLEKFGPYTEDVSVDRSEYRMCISFIQKGGKGLFYNEYQSLLSQKNPDSEPSTTMRSTLTTSQNPIIKIIRDTYRQIRYNFDLRFLSVNDNRHTA